MKKYFKKYMLILFRGWIGSILVALLIATSFKSAIADWYIVPTGSMKPTIVEGDYIFTNKLAYDLRVPCTTIRIASWDDPKRGDIVVLISPADGKHLVKRVVGIPGDHISMQDNRLFINGEAVQYESLDQKEFETIVSDMNADHQYYTENLTGKKHKVMITPYRLSPRSFGTIVVPEERYFMMGDNRDNSMDSRFFGFIERKRILCRAYSIVISLDIENHYWPRWKRFFTKLI